MWLVESLWHLAAPLPRIRCCAHTFAFCCSQNLTPHLFQGHTQLNNCYVLLTKQCKGNYQKSMLSCQKGKSGHKIRNGNVETWTQKTKNKQTKKSKSKRKKSAFKKLKKSILIFNNLESRFWHQTIFSPVFKWLKAKTTNFKVK